METHGLDPACSNMISAAGGSPDPRMVITASFDSHTVTIRQVPSSARKSDDSMSPAGREAVLSSQAERRSPSRTASTTPSTIVTNRSEEHTSELQSRLHL